MGSSSLPSLGLDHRLLLYLEGNQVYWQGTEVHLAMQRLLKLSWGDWLVATKWTHLGKFNFFLEWTFQKLTVGYLGQGYKKFIKDAIFGNRYHLRDHCDFLRKSCRLHLCKTTNWPAKSNSLCLCKCFLFSVSRLHISLQHSPMSWWWCFLSVASLCLELLMASSFTWTQSQLD